MDFLKGLFRGVSPASRAGFFEFTVRCKRCGETIQGRVNLNNDLSVEYEGDRTTYFARKLLAGSGRCFQQIEVELKFNAGKQLSEKQVNGGEFVE